MKVLSAKYKIFIALAVWLVVCFLAVANLFKILENSNEQTLAKIRQQQKDLGVLKNERESYILAKEDLGKLEEQWYQPDDFFSSDLTFVGEIKTFEELADRLNLEMNLSGLAGTIESLPKASTKGEVFVVPYGLYLNGQFADIVEFIENLENLSFVTTISSVTVGGASGGRVNANLAGSFFLKRK